MVVQNRAVYCAAKKNQAAQGRDYCNHNQRHLQRPDRSHKQQDQALC